MVFSPYFSILLGIISMEIPLVGFILLNYRTNPGPIILLIILGLLVGFIAIILEIKIRKKILNNEIQAKLKKIGISFGILGILLNIIPWSVVATSPAIETYITIHPITTFGKITKVKTDQQTIAIALESYYIDHCVYPAPDIDENGNYILPHFLTTPLAYPPCGSTTKQAVIFVSNSDMVHDPFNHNGKGIYGYGGGPVRVGEKITSPQSGWIITSYGPDRVPGNSGVPGGNAIDPTKAWTDIIYNYNLDSTTVLSFDLRSSGLTYDPTNGLVSPGDIWRRGP